MKSSVEQCLNLERLVGRFVQLDQYLGANGVFQGQIFFQK